MHQGVVMTETLYHTLVAWVEKHYRDSLSPDDLADPQLAIEVRTALEQQFHSGTNTPAWPRVMRWQAGTATWGHVANWPN